MPVLNVLMKLPMITSSDEWLMSSLMEYKGKELVNVAKDDLQESEKPKVSESDQDIIAKIYHQIYL